MHQSSAAGIDIHDNTTYKEQKYHKKGPSRKDLLSEFLVFCQGYPYSRVKTQEQLGQWH